MGLRTAVFLLSVALVLAACGKDEAEPASPVAGACPKVATIASPESALAVQYDLMRKKDVDCLWELYSDGYKRVLERMKRDLLDSPDEDFVKRFGFPKAEITGLDAKAVFKRMMTAKGNEFALEKTPRVERVEKQSKSRVLVHFDKGEAKCRQAMRRVGQSWRVDGLTACSSESKPKETEPHQR